MRLGIRAKQIAGVTTIIAVTVVALSGLYVTQLAKAVLRENEKLAQLIAKQIYQRAFEVARQATEPYAALQQDPGLRSILQSTIYGDVLSGAAIIDTDGLVVASDDESRIGLAAAAAARAGHTRRRRTTRAASCPLRGRRRDLRIPGKRMTDASRGDEEFGSIRIGVSTVLRPQRDEGSVAPGAAHGGRGPARGRDRRGASVAAPSAADSRDPQRTDAAWSRENSASRWTFRRGTSSVSSARSSTKSASSSRPIGRLLAGQKANLQSAVEHLEDAVALFDPSGQLLFSNPAMQPTLPADAIGRALHGLLSDGHPYRTLVEETLATRVVTRSGAGQESAR